MNKRVATLVIHICITGILFLSLTQFLALQLTGVNVTGPIILALTFAALGSAAVSRRLQPQLGPGMLVLFIWILSFRNVADPGTLTQGAVDLLPVVILGLCVRVELKVLLRCLAVGGVVLIVALALNGLYDNGRLILPNTNPIWIARMGVLAFLAVLFGSPIRYRPVNWVIALSLTVMMWLTGSRGPILAAWAALLLFMAMKTKGRNRAFFVLGTMIATISSGGWLGGTIVPTRANGDVNSEWRVAAWQQALHLWTSRPVLGYGVGFDELSNGQDPYPHNAFLEVLVQSGAAGLGIFLAVIWLTWRVNKSPVFRSILVATLIFSATSGSVWGAFELWLFILLRVDDQLADTDVVLSCDPGPPAAGPHPAGPVPVATAIHRTPVPGARSR